MEPDIGCIDLLEGSTPPSGWLHCDGSDIAPWKQPSLYKMIGHKYGDGHGHGSASLPDLRDCEPAGKIYCIFTGRTLVGFVDLFEGDTPPSGWLHCDGSDIAPWTHQELSRAIGHKYGDGHGHGSASLPDLRKCEPTGKIYCIFNGNGSAGPSSQPHNGMSTAG